MTRPAEKRDDPLNRPIRDQAGCRRVTSDQPSGGELGRVVDQLAHHLGRDSLGAVTLPLTEAHRILGPAHQGKRIEIAGH